MFGLWEITSVQWGDFRGEDVSEYIYIYMVVQCNLYLHTH